MPLSALALAPSLALALLVPAPVAGHPPPAAEVRTALAALHAWDGARAGAYVAGDPDRLRALYAPGSSAAAADVRLLGAYTAHGWRITAMATQVRSVRVLAHGPDRWRLRTVDRVRALAATPQRCRPLPAGSYRSRDVVLVRSAGGWRVSSVRPGPSPARR
ncbi:MAG: hypothetical protein ACTHNS_03980 [Marmoricola sp.]